MAIVIVNPRTGKPGGFVSEIVGYNNSMKKKTNRWRVLFVTLIIVSFMFLPKKALAASYPLLLPSTLDINAFVGDEVSIEYRYFPEYKNERIEIEVFSPDGVVVAKSTKSFYNTSSYVQKYTVTWNTEGMSPGHYKVVAHKYFYSLYSWHETPTTTDSFIILACVHNWDEGTVTQNPTCINEGVKTFTCTICGETKTESISATGIHSWDNGLETQAPTCVDNGVKTFTCTICGEKKTESISATGIHVWDNGVITTEPTLKAEGIKTFTCSVCGEKRTETISKKIDSTIDRPVDPSAAPTLEKAEKELLNSRKDEAPEGAVFNLLQLRATKVSKNSIKIQWTKVKGAKGYIIYGANCGQKYKKLKTIKKGSTISWTQKKLKKGKYYKYYIVATAKYKGKDKVIASSKTIHIATSGGQVGNFKSVKLSNIKKNELNLKLGKKFTIKAKAVAASKKLKAKNHRKLAYESTNPAVATVSKKGKISAKASGNCYIYVYAQNGVFQKIKVTVS